MGVESENGAYKFKGQVALKGLLTASWVQDYVDEKGKVIEIHFYPQRDQIPLLPMLKQDDYEEAGNRLIILNRLNKKNKQLVKSFFKYIPYDFIKYQEGIIEQPAVVVLDDYITYVECDSRYYEAKLIRVEQLSQNDVPLVKKSGCPTQYSLDGYTTYSKDGFVNLRAEPKKESKVVMKLANDKVLEKIRTSGNWFYVKLAEKPEVRGYVHKSQVLMIN